MPDTKKPLMSSAAFLLPVFYILFCSVEHNAETIFALLLYVPGQIIIRRPQEPCREQPLLHGAVWYIVGAEIKGFKAELLASAITEPYHKITLAGGALLKIYLGHYKRSVFNNDRAGFVADMQTVAALSIMLDTGIEKF